MMEGIFISVLLNQNFTSLQFAMSVTGVELKTELLL